MKKYACLVLVLVLVMVSLPCSAETSCEFTIGDLYFSLPDGWAIVYSDRAESSYICMYDHSPDLVGLIVSSVSLSDANSYIDNNSDLDELLEIISESMIELNEYTDVREVPETEFAFGFKSYRLIRALCHDADDDTDPVIVLFAIDNCMYYKIEFRHFSGDMSQDEFDQLFDDVISNVFFTR